MVISLHTIIELVLNTLKNSFLTGELGIKTSTYNNGVILLKVRDNEELEDRLYSIRLYTEPSNDGWRCISNITIWVDITGEEVVSINNWIAKALNHFQDSATRVLEGCIFHASEVEEIK